MKIEHHLDLTADDRADERAFIGEIMRKLRAADRRGRAHPLHVRRRQALSDDQLGSGPPDSIAGGPALGGAPLFVWNVRVAHFVRLSCECLRLWDIQPSV